MAKFQNKYRIESSRLKEYNYASAGFYFITICTENREHYFGEIKNSKMQLSNIGVLADVFWHEIKNHSTNIKLHEFVVMPNHVHGILEIVDGGDDGGIGNGGDVAIDNDGDDGIGNGGDDGIGNGGDVGIDNGGDDGGIGNGGDDGIGNGGDVVIDNDGDVAVDNDGDVAVDNDGDVAVDNCRDVACNVSTITTDDPITNNATITTEDPINKNDSNDDTNKSVPEKNQQMSKISPKSGSIGRIIGSYKGAVTKHCNRLGFEFGWQSRFNDHIIRNNKSLNKIQNYIKNNPRNWKEDKFFK